MTHVSDRLSGQLLIALPSLADSNFARAVVLVCQHDEEGAMGVVVNRPSDYTLGEILAQMDIATADEGLRERVVLAGGPVHPERGFVIHDDPRPRDSGLTIDTGLYLTTSRDILQAMAEGGGPASALMALGCAGWGAGQLEAELAENSWLTAPADPALLFEVPLAERWQAAAGRIGVDMFRMTDYSGHA
ncbi:YqgE/AlgH family protein [Xanthomonas massiliensis]|uniref:YqgE/AlgH family protein n=1 Tax=Xanthomonas massiliensis TaxID=1720302 RepID=UPI000825F677|nr:YqgE/AlgH family protein [Xanthomonas massiliensis]